MKLKTLIKWQVMPFLAVLLSQGTCDEPKFVYPIDNITVAVGRDASFTCVVDKLQGHKVAWIKSDRMAILAIHTHMITKNPRIKVSHNGDNTWRLHIHDVRHSDSGPYMCQINTDTMVSQIGMLEVIEAPEILHNDTSNNTISLESGDAVDCETRGCTPEPPLTRQTREDKQLRDGTGQVHGVVSGLEIVEFPNEPITVEVGKHATISCKIVGNPRPTVEWTFVSTTQRMETKVLTHEDDPKAGRVIQHDGSLHFFKTTFEDKGMYWCKASIPATDSDPGQEIKSDTATLTVVPRQSAPIEFQYEPNDEALATGRTVTLSCQTTGCPKKMTQLHWEYRGTWTDKTSERLKVMTLRDDESRSNKLILKDGSLRIRNVQPEDEGIYYCVAACNPYENRITSRSAWLHVTDGHYPVFLEEPQDTEAVFGEPAVLKCRINPVFHQSSTSIEWYFRSNRKNEKVETTVDSPDSEFSVLHDGSLYISRVGYSVTDKEFFCTVSTENQGKQTSKRAKLTSISKGEDVLVAPSDQTVQVAGTVTLDCQIDNVESITWVKRQSGIESKISTTNNEDKDFLANFYQLFNNSLRMENVQIGDRGTYLCKATDYLSSKSYALPAEVTLEEAEYNEWIPVAVGVMSDYLHTPQFRPIGDGNEHDFEDLYLADYCCNLRMAVAFFDEELYFCGGYNPLESKVQQTATKTCKVLGEVGQHLTEVNMLEARKYLTLNRVGNKLVAIGGQKEDYILDTTEILETGSNKEWRAGPKLTVPRMYHCTVTYSDKEVIIIGGVTDYNSPVPDDAVLLFNIETGTTKKYTGAQLRAPAYNLACGLTESGQLLIAYAEPWADSCPLCGTFKALDIRSLIEKTHSDDDDDGSVGWYNLPSLPDVDYQRPYTMLVKPGVIWLQNVTPNNNEVGDVLKYEYPNDKRTTKDDLTKGKWTALFHGFDDPVLSISAVLVPSYFRYIPLS